MTVLHINRPNTFPLRRITNCPTCNQRRRFSGLDAPWYGVTWQCCGCGDSWTDGERHPRPFQRGWRAKAVANARLVWAQAAGLTRADHRTWLDAEIHAGDGTGQA